LISAKFLADAGLGDLRNLWQVSADGKIVCFVWFSWSYLIALTRELLGLLGLFWVLLLLLLES